jgi:hypothetical protein
LPLALELAAGRANVLTPRLMLVQLEKQLAFLIRSRPGGDSRHNSLRAALAFTVDHFSPEVRAVFASLSVFPGSFSLEAAQAIGEAGLITLNAIDELELHSLLQAVFTLSDAGEEVRYRLRTVVREYADDLLAPAERNALRRRHADYYHETTKTLQQIPEAERFVQTLQVLRHEEENLQGAFEHALEQQNTEAVRSFFDVLALAWFENGNWGAFRRLTDAVEPLFEAEGATQSLAKLLGLKGAYARRRGLNEEAWQCWERRLVAAWQLDNNELALGTLIEMTSQAIDENKNDIAEAYIEQINDIIRNHGLENYTVNKEVLCSRLEFSKKNYDSAIKIVEYISENINNYHYSSIIAKIHLSFYISRLHRELFNNDKTLDLLHFVIKDSWKHDLFFSVCGACLELGKFYTERDLVKSCIAHHIAVQIGNQTESRWKNLCTAEWETFQERHGASTADILNKVQQNPDWRFWLQQILAEPLSDKIT